MTPQELKTIRAGLRLSQAGLAAAMGISPKTVQGWEQGWRKVPLWAVKFLDCLLQQKQSVV